MSKCVKSARIFLNRMLQFLRDMGDKCSMALPVDFCKDLNWFITFLRQFSGVVYYNVKPIQADLQLDACLTGFGGIFDNQYYVFPTPKALITTPLFTWRC